MAIVHNVGRANEPMNVEVSDQPQGISATSFRTPPL